MLVSKRAKTAVDKEVFLRSPLRSPVLKLSSTRKQRKVRFMCWNVNGLKSAVEKHHQAFVDTVKSSNPDVIFLQETKLQENLVSQYSDCLAAQDYTTSLFCCSTAKKGYSGTALLIKRDVQFVSKSCIEILPDQEGRSLLLEFDSFYFLGCYVPNSGQKLERLSYRVNKHDEAVRTLLNKLAETKPVIYGGDLNVAHADLDVWNPQAPHLKKQAGCTLEERTSFSHTLEPGKWVDSFRYLYPDASGHFTFWSTRAGNKPWNRGMRLDYFVVPHAMMDPAAKVFLCDSWCVENPPEGVSDHGPICCDVLVDEE